MIHITIHKLLDVYDYKKNIKTVLLITDVGHFLLDT